MSSLARCRFAMQKIYGPFESIPLDQVRHWTPPPMSEGHRGRYLWTDGFAVVNFITLFKETSEERYLQLARRLINTVHDILGRTRDGQARLPGATDEFPLKGGLRIGKHRATGPDGDGQYHHYLTIWMFALNRMSLASKDMWYNSQAISLAKAIHPHFMINRDSARPRMFWKLSMDLQTPLVTSEGNLDPIDGYVILNLLQETSGGTELTREINDYKKILDTKWKHYKSDDPLDLGMTLWTTHWFTSKEEWATALTQRAFESSLYEDDRYFDRPLSRRLAFREFGTCLGIACQHPDEEWTARVEKILSRWDNSDLINSTPEQLQAITMVMYATARLPGAFCKDYLN